MRAKEIEIPYKIKYIDIVAFSLLLTMLDDFFLVIPLDKRIKNMSLKYFR